MIESFVYQLKSFQNEMKEKNSNESMGRENAMEPNTFISLKGYIVK